MVYVYEFTEEWSPLMDSLSGYYYELEEDAVKILINNGYEYSNNLDIYCNNFSKVRIVKLKRYI